MTVAVVHAAVADASFSAAGATNWNAGHNITGLANAVAFFDSAGALADSALLTFDPTTKRLTVGTGSGASIGLVLGNHSNAGYGAIWSTGVVADENNYSLAIGINDTYLKSTSSSGSLNFYNGVTAKASITGTAGSGFYITAGTAITDVNALSLTQTWNAAGVAFTGLKFTITDTASAASALAMQILGGASGTTNLFKIDKAGGLTTPDIGTAAAWVATSYVKINDGGRLMWSSEDVDISRISAGLLAVGTGLAGSFAGRIKLTSAIVAATTVANLNASPTVGEISTVNDASAVTAKGATLAAGGSSVAQVIWNGTNWVGT